MGKNRVLHMFSGGRDSLLSSALLVEEGYDVELITFDNGHISNIECVSTTADFLIEQYSAQNVTYLNPSKMGMLLHEYMQKEWNRKYGNRPQNYSNLYLSQIHCLSCKTAMYVHAIAYCKAHDIHFLSEGARKQQGFMIELSEMKERYEKICKENDITLLWKVYDLDSDLKRKRLLEDRGLPTKVLEPQCYLGCPLQHPLTKLERDELVLYFDEELYPHLNNDIDSLVPAKEFLMR